MKTERDDFVLLNNGTFTSMESFNVLDFIRDGMMGPSH